MMTALMLNACKNDNTMNNNPLLSDYKTPYKVPPFEEIKPAHYMPAFEKAMEEHKQQIEAITGNGAEPTFENTVEALAYSGNLLEEVSAVFFGLNSANTSDELQNIANKISPKLSKHYDEINMNPELFKRVKAVYENRDEYDLNEEQAYLLENLYKDFIRSGADLPAGEKEKLQKINQELSTLSLNFGQNVLAETNAFKLVVEKKEDLTGLPESVIQSAAETAKERGHEGKWVFTTHKPSMIPFLQYAENRELREKLYSAYINRGNNDNEHDNKEILAKMMKLRVEKAHLLGYKTHADYRLETRMAKKPENVMNLLNRLWDAALPVAKQERTEMQQIINSEDGDFKLQSWDWWYYAEKLRKQKYNLDDSELRPYFKLDNVRNGAFSVAKKLYGLSFEEIKEIPRPHPDAQAFKVIDKDGSHLGVMFMDFHPRASKRGGAWNGDYRDHYVMPSGKGVPTVTTVVCNFTKPSGNEPALISMDEVETLFHEFGHALDGLFAQNTYPETYVARDFVELPSQIMEHWATEPEVLKMYAKHNKTGETIPQELIDKLKNSGYFNQGFATVEYLAASLLDMAYHTMEEPKEVDVMAFENDYLNSIGLIPEIISRYRSTYFRHITGGYDAGYYSYIWSGVLDNDAFEAFRENGIFDQKTAESFRKNVLEKNGIKDPAKLYRDFRGRDPKEEPLLKNRGLI